MLFRLLPALLLAAVVVTASPAAARGLGESSTSHVYAALNPAAVRPAVKLYVERAGIQHVSSAALRAAGMDLAAIDTSRLWLRKSDQAVALEVLADGVRFFAPEPGDRWNAGDTYWLTLEVSPGPRINGAPQPAVTELRTTALQTGIVRGTLRYDSLAPGPDGDHWFLADLRAGPDLPPASVTVALPETMPVVAGEALRLQINGSSYAGGTHRLRVRAAAVETTVVWSGDGDWSQTVTLTPPASSVTLTLLGTQADATLVDSVSWQRTITLDAQQSGAFFKAYPGALRYQVANLPAAAALYDVTEPHAVRSVPLTAGAFVLDGETAGRALVLAGPSTFYEPAASAHAPLDTSAPRDADVIYIAPVTLHAALEPLLAQRRAQGYRPIAIDTRVIYDTWSAGQVSPAAIRAFLQHARATWPRRPVAAILVGDGSSDPLDRTARGANNVNLVPPYLAMVDPWIGETACEACYAHLDGDDPRADPAPDLLIGRLPVKSSAELSALVAKIVAYENAPPGGDWRRRLALIADNYREADRTIDRAGDFAATADELAALLPAGFGVQKVYYDPTTSGDGSDGRVPDARVARLRVSNPEDDDGLGPGVFQQGAGIVTFFGHGSNFQWATTDLSQQQPYLLGLYDADAMTNGDTLPMVLSMTCLTGAFQAPAFSGTTIDERLVLNPAGGAVAVLAPTGFGVLHGHDAIVRGFFRAMVGLEPAAPGVRDWRAIGLLVQAGYREVRATAPCCDDAVYTFALLGDPLTPLRSAERRIMVPVALR
jgi:hypothetical protein